LGHKVHPNAFRLGVIRGWEANWFASHRDYTKLLHEDLEMRQMIMGRLRNAGIAKIETERSSNAQMTVTIHTAKPGIVIGKGGASVDQLRENLERRFPGNRIRISIQEIKHPELDAKLVAENIASQIERRINHRRAMKQSILRTMRAGAKGVRIYMGGRLRGGEMARKDWDRAGRVPLHTLRADIDFGRAEAKTTFGVIGIKCWIYKELLEPKKRGGVVEETAAAPSDAPSSPDGPPRRRRRRGGSGGGGGQPGGAPRPQGAPSTAGSSAPSASAPRSSAPPASGSRPSAPPASTPRSEGA
jgi:small subunit ribosomal protein S3